MSYICEFCGVRPEKCGCSVDLTEPRLETELAVADNMMAVENSNIQKPYGLLDAPSASAFFSLLVELERQEADGELGPEPKWMCQSNNQDKPLGTIPTTPRKSSKLFPPIPKLERQTNMPEGIKLPDEDLKDLSVALFPEYCETCCNFSCECDMMVPCECGTLYDIRESYKMCYKCEMAMRRQDSIDQVIYPDDIQDRYRYDSD